MEYIQLSLFGKTSPEPSAATKAKIFGPSLKKSQRAEFQCLIAENGQGPEWLELAGLTSLGGRWMPNIGESPNVEKESFLWQILEADAPPKYSLSPKACLGILKRAQKRNRELPPLLEAVLKYQAGISDAPPMPCNAPMKQPMQARP